MRYKSKYIPGNQKRLTLNDRIFIKNELKKGASFKDIARFLCKNPTTISKEVKTHRVPNWYHKSSFNNVTAKKSAGLFGGYKVIIVNKYFCCFNYNLYFF